MKSNLSNLFAIEFQDLSNENENDEIEQDFLTQDMFPENETTNERENLAKELEKVELMINSFEKQNNKKK